LTLRVSNYLTLNKAAGNYVFPAAAKQSFIDSFFKSFHSINKAAFFPVHDLMTSNAAGGGVSISFCFWVNFLAKRNLLNQKGYVFRSGGVRPSVVGICHFLSSDNFLTNVSFDRS